MENQISQRKILEEQLITKALKDETFRNQLIKNPHKTISEEFGVTIPESITINVLTEDARTFYLVLPFVQEMGAGDELSESELQRVAAGDGGFFDTECSTWSWIMTQCNACSG